MSKRGAPRGSGVDERIRPREGVRCAAWGSVVRAGARGGLPDGRALGGESEDGRIVLPRCRAQWSWAASTFL